MELKAKIDALKEEALAKIKASENLDSLNQVRVAYLGKKGPLTEVLRGMKDLSAEERPKIGALANVVRDEITTMLEEKKALLEMEKINQALAAETVDVTLPGNHVGVGQPHVLTQIIEEIEDLFIGMGYSIIEGPEVEEDRYNFEMMNLP